MADEIFDFLEIRDENFKESILKDFKSNYGPTDSSNWLTKYILIGRQPNNCEEIKKIIDSDITIFLSLREYEEEYVKCIKLIKKNYKKCIFTRFNIPDFGTRDADLIKSLIDNIINYIKINKKKIMIHCLGGHGRTGMIIVPLIAVFLFIKEIKNKKSINYIDINEVNKWISFDDKINNVAENLFKKAQAYIMISLRMHRKTNSSNLKTMKQIKIPETHAQDNIAKEVIKIYINNYLRTGKLYDNQL